VKDVENLNHTRGECKYHVVFTSKIRGHSFWVILNRQGLPGKYVRPSLEEDHRSVVGRLGRSGSHRHGILNQFAEDDAVSHCVDVRPAFTLYRNCSVARKHGRAITLFRLLGVEKSPLFSGYHCKHSDIKFYRIT